MKNNLVTSSIHPFLLCSLYIFCICNTLCSQSEVEYDIVLANGRVIDPETKLDAIKNVGIIDNHIAEISSTRLKGKTTIDVSGLVVAPGFIDLHVHGRDNREQEFQLHDGITTALELEWGIENIGRWYESRNGKALINYGASASWPYERFKSIDKYADIVTLLSQKTDQGASSIEGLMKAIMPAANEQISAAELDETLMNINTSLEEGALGIGVPIGYLPKTNPLELYKVFQFAGERNIIVYTHVRDSDMLSLQEVICNAMLTKTPLHIVHINSMALGNIELALDMIHTAQNNGFDISTELYPYTAGSTAIQSAIFDDGWQEKRAISYEDLQWVETGERLTKESFDAYRKTGGIVILHAMKPEWIKIGMAAEDVMIASDGMPYARLAHPRTAGTFSRVLGKYVREEKVLDLMSAIEKMTLLPAKRLEVIAPMMRFMGRIQVGARADITIFDPNTIIDKATFEQGLAFSEGIEYVIVNGSFVLKNGQIVANAFPGQAIVGKYKK